MTDPSDRVKLHRIERQTADIARRLDGFETFFRDVINQLPIEYADYRPLLLDRVMGKKP